MAKINGAPMASQTPADCLWAKEAPPSARGPLVPYPFGADTPLADAESKRQPASPRGRQPIENWFVPNPSLIGQPNMRLAAPPCLLRRGTGRL